MSTLVKPGKTHRKNRIREGSIVADVIMYAISVFVIFITLYPMYYILIISLSAPEVAITMKVYVRPIGLNLNAYQVLLKNTDHPIVQIAFHLGFSSSIYFSQCFQRREGLSPSEYRLRSRQEGQEEP